MRDVRLSSLTPMLNDEGEYDSDSDGEGDGAVGASLLGRKLGRLSDARAGGWIDSLRRLRGRVHLQRPPSLTLSSALLAPAALVVLALVALFSVSRILCVFLSHTIM